MKEMELLAFMLLMNTVKIWAQKYPRYMGSRGGIPIYAPYEQSGQRSGIGGSNVYPGQWVDLSQIGTSGVGNSGAPQNNPIGQPMSGNSASPANMDMLQNIGMANPSGGGSQPLSADFINSPQPGDLGTGLGGISVDPAIPNVPPSSSAYPNGVFRDIYKQNIGPVYDLLNSGTPNIYDPAAVSTALNAPQYVPQDPFGGALGQQPVGNGPGNAGQAIDIRVANGQGVPAIGRPGNTDILIDVATGNTAGQPYIGGLNGRGQGLTPDQMMTLMEAQNQGSNAGNFGGQLVIDPGVPMEQQNQGINTGTGKNGGYPVDPAVASLLGNNQPVIVIPIRLDHQETKQMLRPPSTAVDPVGIEPMADPGQVMDPNLRNKMPMDATGMLDPSQAIGLNSGNGILVDTTSVVDPLSSGNAAIIDPTALDPIMMDPRVGNEIAVQRDPQMATDPILLDLAANPISMDPAAVDPPFDPKFGGLSEPKYRSPKHYGKYGKKYKKQRYNSYGKTYYKPKYGKSNKNYGSYGKSISRTYGPSLSYGKPLITYGKPKIAYGKPKIKYSKPKITYGKPKLYGKSYGYGRQKTYYRPKYGKRLYSKPKRYYSKSYYGKRKTYKKGGY